MTKKVQSIRNISFLMTMSGQSSNTVGLIENGAVIVDNGRIAWVGKDADCPKAAATGKAIDASGMVVMPGLVDCHTHLVFAGDRVNDFYARAKGETYAQIMARGGGIQHSVAQTRAASASELVEAALPRLRAILELGITTVEVKSGYGLNLDDEIKILEVVKELNAKQPVSLIPTFLGAHSVPMEFKGQAGAYVDYLIAKVLPEVAKRKLAAAIDVFVEQGAFCIEDARRLLESAQGLGLRCKIHADQLTHSGGTALASELKILSASHLEHASEMDLAALARSGVVAEVLPLSELYLGMTKVADLRCMCDMGVKVAIATDFNPGSSMCHDLQLAMRLAVTHRKMTVEEAYLGVTHHAACALGMEDEVGQIKVGMRADVIMLEGSSPWSFAYDWTHNPVRRVIKAGELMS
jgi:imidazolonepropionase